MDGGGGMNAEMWLSHADEVRPQRELQRAVWDELRWEPEADTADVHVGVEDFVATISGTVPSYRARFAVERSVERVPGIRSVVNGLAVVLPVADARADGVLAAAVANALQWDGRVPHGRLIAEVMDGWVTLGGSVDRQVDRAAAEETVQNLTGVRGVTNQIAVEPPQAPVELKRLAEAALEHRALRGARIALETHERTVALHGRVHSIADRRAAAQAVWAVPGVAAVVDLLTIR